MAFQVKIDDSRDELLSDFGKATLYDRYLLPDETPQQLFARVAAYYADDEAHAQRLYDYISKHWFMPATPILSNGGTQRGLPISCFLNEASDSLEGIVELWKENVYLAANGGGIGSYFGALRPIGDDVRKTGKTSGIIPFVHVVDGITLAISQGGIRRGSAAVYIPISHPEVEEFIEIRRPTGGDPNRKALNLHHGLMISDAFMHAVEHDLTWYLRSPKNNNVVATVSARKLWIRILTARIETGEPYLVFSDRVAEGQPEHHKSLGLKVKTSNLCSEITLPTGPDHLNKQRTAVCCLSSLNLERFLEWQSEPKFIEDVLRFLDNVLTDFIKKAPKQMNRAVYSAERERSVGLGVMGFHSFLQQQGIPFESAMAKVWNKRMFVQIKKAADEASLVLGEERGPCPDSAECGGKERFSHKMAIAPTASISVITGSTSPGIEPISANLFVQKTLSGSFTVRNRHLQKLLAERGQDNQEVWSSIAVNKGSVQHLECLSQDEKDIYRTAFELDQRWVVEHAVDRTPYICQSQSVNLFLPADIHKRDLHQIHFQAWKKGMKSLYYCRSLAINRADNVSEKVVLKEREINYEECLACQ